MHAGSFLRTFGGKAFAHGNAYYIDGCAGAAAEADPGRPALVQDRLLTSGQGIPSKKLTVSCSIAPLPR